MSNVFRTLVKYILTDRNRYEFPRMGMNMLHFSCILSPSTTKKVIHKGCPRIFDNFQLHSLLLSTPFCLTAPTPYPRGN